MNLDILQFLLYYKVSKNTSSLVIPKIKNIFEYSYIQIDMLGHFIPLS